jgi:transposase-like protein
MDDSTAVTLRPELVEELMRAVKSPEDVFGPTGLIHRLKAALMERMLEAEMTEHLGFEKNAVDGRGGGNARNGYTTKTVKTDTGPVEIRVPRDRLGTFEPKLVAKHQRRLPGFDEKVLALYARGMSVRDIQSHLQELYGTEVAPELISRVTDAVLDEMREWQARPLEAVYPIVYIDALFVSMRDGGVVTKKAVYVALGQALDGGRDVLGLWIEANEGARFWLRVLTELKNRGIQDILFVCCDGLSGITQAIEAAFPKAIVQTCIVHMIRASLRYVTNNDRAKVVGRLREVYGADTEDAALHALTAIDKEWGERYPGVAKLWRSRWREVTPFLGYPKPIRRMLYTTNAIESLNFQLRKVLRPKGHFPTEDSVLKVLYLAIQRAKMKWKRATDWQAARAHFAIVFADRMPA